MAWNWLRVEIRPDDGGAFPTYGEGGMSHSDAHAYVQDMLNAAAAFSPAMGDLAARWRQGAPDDTVYAGLNTWALYEYPDGGDPRRGATDWLDGFVETMRSTGLNIATHWPQN